MMGALFLAMVLSALAGTLIWWLEKRHQAGITESWRQWEIAHPAVRWNVSTFKELRGIASQIGRFLDGEPDAASTRPHDPNPP